MLFAGCNDHRQLGTKSNNKSFVDNCPIISPFIKPNIDALSISSFSIYKDHSVLITTDGEIYGCGYTDYGKIVKSFQKGDLKEFTKFEIKQNDNTSYHPISAVCGNDFTLYMISRTKNSTEHLLAYSYSRMKTNQLFLKTGNKNPISLFGGYSYAATINSDNSITFIPESVREYPLNDLESYRLPDNQEPVSIACCCYFIYVLSSTGRVFASEINSESEFTEIDFYEVPSLKGKKILEISGTWDHCFAINENYKVFGLGSNISGELCFENERNSSSISQYNFKEISSLNMYEIQHAYAGYNHSLFQTKDGKIIACGCNDFGELLGQEPTNNVFYPFETKINNGAKFCIVGEHVSVVFLDHIPENSPNIKIKNEAMNLPDMLSSEMKLTVFETDIEKVSKSFHHM